ncbi:MAG: CDP-diacylglycerol--glycerol-3-phosphate 3-phosphatidyltransferase [Gammaproteobacteria bacterium]|nr:MAG: CDP-diacylglycerol--glycerol-3-phosphate 3-phosphatidyltransferase [Gammaproteobacteria bacterium]
MLTIPNMLTFSRILAIPLFVIIFYLPFQWSYGVAAIIFIVAGVTDWFDGYLARRLNQVSKLGAFLDPVADKLMVAVALVLLVEMHATVWLALPALVMVSREILVSALREWMAECGQRAAVAVSYIGKVKTVVQMISISMLLAIKPTFGDDGGLLFIGTELLAYLLLYVALVLTLWSMFIYLKAAWPNLIEASVIDPASQGK